MNKKIIAIASILKPLKDVRHYERFALSLAKTNKYDINIIANGEKKPSDDNIRFHSNGTPGRKLFQRLLIQWQTWKLILESRPDILILCSVELLPFSIFYSIFFGGKIIYDVQENYTMNFRHLGEYGFIHKYLLSHVVRLWEWLSTYYIDHYFLAEKCYEKELIFLKYNYTILENKTVLETPFQKDKTNQNPPLHFLFSGTLSKYAGIHRIVALIHDLKQTKVDFEFTIIGQYFNDQIGTLLRQTEAQNVHLIIDRNPIPHQQILEAIKNADVGVIAYKSNIVNKNKVPTKLYEYTAYGLPYLVENGSRWLKIGQEFGGAIPFDFEDPTPEQIANKVMSAQSTYQNKDRSNSLWSTEEEKLIKSIDHLII